MAQINPLGRHGPKKLTPPNIKSLHDLLYKHMDANGQGGYIDFACKFDNMYPKICIFKVQIDAAWDATVDKLFPLFRAHKQVSQSERDALYHYCLSRKDLVPENPKCRNTIYWNKKCLKWGVDDLLTLKFPFTLAIVQSQVAGRNPRSKPDTLFIEIGHKVDTPEIRSKQKADYNSIYKTDSNNEPDIDDLPATQYTPEEIAKSQANQAHWSNMAPEISNGTFVETTNDEDDSEEEVEECQLSVSEWYDMYTDAELELLDNGQEESEDEEVDEEDDGEDEMDYELTLPTHPKA